MKESDLYPAVKTYLEKLGYTVKGEVENCDVVAVRADEAPVVVELKLTLNLGVILQAVERRYLSDFVYVAVPRKCAPLRSRQRAIIKLFRMLGLGLLSIEPHRTHAAVDVLLDPGPYAPRPSKPKRQRLLREFVQRVGDPNQGGADRRRGIMTAYRQKALRISRHIDQNGSAKAACIARDLAIPNARAILYDNVYGWFERITTGVYGLSEKGGKETAQWTGGSPETPAGLPTDQCSKTSEKFRKPAPKTSAELQAHSELEQ